MTITMHIDVSEAVDSIDKARHTIATSVNEFMRNYVEEGTP